MPEQNDDLDRPHPAHPAWTVRQWREMQAKAQARAQQMAEVDNAAQVTEWEANERFRAGHVAKVTLEMVALGASPEDVAGMVAEARARPNEWWGEMREERTPHSDM